MHAAEIKLFLISCGMLPFLAFKRMFDCFARPCFGSDVLQGFAKSGWGCGAMERLPCRHPEWSRCRCWSIRLSVFFFFKRRHAACARMLPGTCAVVGLFVDAFCWSGLWISLAIVGRLQQGFKIRTHSCSEVVLESGITRETSPDNVLGFLRIE